MASLKGDRLEALYVVTLTLGLRRGEVLGLKWADLRPEEERPDDQEDAREKLALVLGEVKTPKKPKIAPCAVGVSGHVEGSQVSSKVRAPEGRGVLEVGLMFTTEIGTPIDPPKLLSRVYPGL